MELARNNYNEGLIEFTTKELIQEVATRCTVFTIGAQLPSEDGECIFASSPNLGAVHMSYDLCDHAEIIASASAMVADYLTEHPEDEGDFDVLQSKYLEFVEQLKEDLDDDTEL